MHLGRVSARLILFRREYEEVGRQDRARDRRHQRHWAGDGQALSLRRSARHRDGKNPATLEDARVSLRGIAEVASSDSGDAGEIESLFTRVAKEHGGLDVLFLNAGIARPLSPRAENLALRPAAYNHPLYVLTT